MENMENKRIDSGTVGPIFLEGMAAVLRISELEQLRVVVLVDDVAGQIKK